MKGILKSKKARRLFASVLTAALLFVSNAVVSFAEMQTESTEPAESEQAVIQPETALAEQTESEQAVIQPETAPTEPAESEQAAVQPEAASTEPAEPSESLSVFLAAIEKLSMLQADDAPAEEVMAVYEEAIASYDALSDGEKALEEVAAAKEALDWFYKVMPLATQQIVKGPYSCGDKSNSGGAGSVKWRLERNTEKPLQYTLIISGNGKMADWKYEERTSTAPWNNEANKIREVQIEYGVTSIGISAFKECTQLVKVMIPGSVKTIKSYAFGNCSSLKSVTIPMGVESIGREVFKYCSSLTEVNISEGVTTIGSDTFMGCSSLTRVEMPQSVTSMDGSVFLGCNSLREVRMNSVPKIQEKYLFADVKLDASKDSRCVLMPVGWNASPTSNYWTNYSKYISTVENDIHPTPDETGYSDAYKEREWETGYGEDGKVYHWKWCVLCVSSVAEANGNPEVYANKRAGLHENGANSYGCVCSERSMPEQPEPSITPPEQSKPPEQPTTPVTPKPTDPEPTMPTPPEPTNPEPTKPTTPTEPTTPEPTTPEPTKPTEPEKSPDPPTPTTPEKPPEQSKQLETPTTTPEQSKQPETPTTTPEQSKQPEPTITPETSTTTAQRDTPEQSSSALAEVAAIPATTMIQMLLPVDVDAVPIADAPYEYPTYQGVTPNPNDPESPETIVVLKEDDVPSVYRKTTDPNNSDNMIYMKDSSSPLAGSPITEKTGHWAFTNFILVVMAASAGIILLRFFVGKRRDKEEEEKQSYYAQ